MKILSIHQPWAWLIVHGFKDVENRTWKTNFRGEFLIHASGRMNKENQEYAGLLRRWAVGADDPTEFMAPGDPLLKRLAQEFPKFDDFPMGGIVGKAELIDCVTQSDSKWFHGPVGFLLKNGQPLPFQECKGKLGFFQDIRNF